MTQASSPDNSKQLTLLLARKPRLALGIGTALIVLLTLFAYLPTFGNGFIWDDNYYVTENKLLTNWEGLQRIWLDVLPRPAEYPLPQYYPLTHTSFWIEYHLWGLKPLGYHVVNFALHLCNVLLIWLLLRKLSVPGAWLAAALFAVHPINVESVAWVAERKNVLSLLFYLSALYVYLRYAGIISGRAVQPRTEEKFQLFELPSDPQRLYGIAATLFLCALFSKTVASSMPIVALLVIWWKRRRITLRDVVQVLPLLVVGVAMGMLTAYMEKVRVGVAARPQEWIYAPTAAGQFAARCMIAGKVIWFYVGKLLAPFPLLFNYPRWSIDPGDVLQYGFLAAAIVALGLLVRLRKRVGAGPLVAVLFYLITLFPAMGFINVWPMQYSFVADHFVYLSSIGLFALAAALLVRYVQIEALAGLSAVVLMLFAGMSWAQDRIYVSPQSIWKDTWERSGQKSWLAANNWGVYLLDHGGAVALPYAEEKFQQTLKLKPDHPEARLNLAHIARRRAELATTLRARAATNPSPELAALIPTTKPAEYDEQAIRWYEDAIAKQPNYVDAHYDLAELLLTLGRKSEALEQLNLVIQYYPRHFRANIALGALAEGDKDYQTAIDHYAQAVEYEPNDPSGHAKLGTALLESGKVQDGFDQWNEVLKLSPADPSWPNDFGSRMLESGEFPKATGYFKVALDRNPRYVPAINNLGIAAVKSGFPEQGRKLFLHALELEPDFAATKENLAALDSGKLRPATRPTTRSTTMKAATSPS